MNRTQQLSWTVKNFDVNKQVIEDYDILKYREDEIKKIKKKCVCKEEFSIAMRRECMYRYWSKCEWELIIEIDENNRIWLNPWAGCREPEKVRIDVTEDTSFEWKGFAEKHIKGQVFKNKAKIDVFDQLEYKWEQFIDYLWNTRLKYERQRKDQ